MSMTDVQDPEDTGEEMTMEEILALRLEVLRDIVEDKEKLRKKCRRRGPKPKSIDGLADPDLDTPTRSPFDGLPDIADIRTGEGVHFCTDDV